MVSKGGTEGPWTNRMPTKPKPHNTTWLTPLIWPSVRAMAAMSNPKLVEQSNTMRHTRTNARGSSPSEMRSKPNTGNIKTAAPKSTTV